MKNKTNNKKENKMKNIKTPPPLTTKTQNRVNVIREMNNYLESVIVNLTMYEGKIGMESFDDDELKELVKKTTERVYDRIRISRNNLKRFFDNSVKPNYMK